MPILGLCVAALVIIYMAHRYIQQKIMVITLLLGGNQRQGIWVYSGLFFPGVVLHELTHFFTAACLGVSTGEISLFPQIPVTNHNAVTLGSVKIAKTDFVRESVIGGAPFLVGLGLMYVLVTVFIRPLIVESGMTFVGVATHVGGWPLRTILALYAIVAITNTMFVSKEDTRAWIPMALCLLLGVTALLVTGSFGAVFSQGQRLLEPVERSYVVCLGVVVFVDLVIGSILGLWQWVLERLTHKKVVKSPVSVR